MLWYYLHTCNHIRDVQQARLVLPLKFSVYHRVLASSELNSVSSDLHFDIGVSTSVLASPSLVLGCTPSVFTLYLLFLLYLSAHRVLLLVGRT